MWGPEKTRPAWSHSSVLLELISLPPSLSSFKRQCTLNYSLQYALREPTAWNTIRVLFAAVSRPFHVVAQQKFRRVPIQNRASVLYSGANPGTSLLSMLTCFAISAAVANSAGPRRASLVCGSLLTTSCPLRQRSNSLLRCVRGSVHLESAPSTPARAPAPGLLRPSASLRLIPKHYPPICESNLIVCVLQSLKTVLRPVDRD